MGFAIALLCIMFVTAGTLLGLLFRYIFFSGENYKKPCKGRDIIYIAVLQIAYSFIGMKIIVNQFPNHFVGGDWESWYFAIFFVFFIFFSIKPIYVRIFKNS